MVRETLAGLLGLVLGSVLVLSVLNFGIKYCEKPKHSSLTCTLKDGSSVKADSFVIRENHIHLSVLGGDILVPYSNLQRCVKAR